MMPSLRPKAERDRINQILGNLAKESWLAAAKRWWPLTLFHFTDVQNAVRILSEGQLLSRRALQGQDVVDSASPEIIASTDPSWQQYVRLYWRPRTPTQYRNEGIRPTSNLELGGAHCPVPIYFVFNATSVLSRSDSRFTAGNAAANPPLLSTPAELSGLPFNYIYHDTYVGNEEKSTIVFHRNAEVLVADRLDLDAVRQIACRSLAEYQTLLYLLPQGVYSRWANRIAVRPDLFFRQWTYVRDVVLGSERVQVRFSAGSKTPGPFKVLAELSSVSGNAKWSKDSYIAKDPLVLKLKSPKTDYALHLHLDSNLAFADRFQEEVLPF